ncbi:MAG: PQQ-binding-like beta-propeller repeat protein [Planctomycetales bacterium]
MMHQALCRGVLAAGVVWWGAAQGLEGADWPRFRGPNGTGISPDADVPVEIGEEQNLLWKVELPGQGNASPIVVDGRVYLQTASVEGDQRMLLCLDLKTGEPIWKHTVSGETGETHAKNTLASCSAAVAGERVFIPFWDGKNLSLEALDLSGKRLWSVDLGPFVSQHGAGHSPVVVGNNVILAIDQDGASEVVALHVDDGRVAWRSPRPAFRASYSTPILFDQPGEGAEVIITSTAGVSGYDPESGSEKWKWTWNSNNLKLRTVGSPIVSQGAVFFTGGNGPGDRHAVAVRIEGRQGDFSEQPAMWETRKVLPYVPCLLSQGEHLYFVNDAGIAGCYVAQSGEKVWENRLGIGGVVASPVMSGGRIYAVSEQGDVSVIAAKTEFQELFTGRINEGVRASPAIADNRLLIRGNGLQTGEDGKTAAQGTAHLYCFGK